MENLKEKWTSGYAGYKMVKKSYLQNIFEFVKPGAHEETVKKYRSLKTSAEKDAMSAFNFPCATLSAICAGSHKFPRQHTGFMVLDFDGSNKGQNLHIQDWVDWVMNLKWIPQIFFAGLSRSGSGAFVVIRLQNATLENHIEYFLNLQEWFRENFQVTVDAQCKNPNRLRFASFNTEETCWFNFDATEWKYKTHLPEYKAVNPKAFAKMDSDKRIASLTKWCDRTIQFTQGSRHSYMIKLAGACCRFAVPKEDTIQFFMNLWENEAVENADDILNTVKDAYTKYSFGCAINN